MKILVQDLLDGRWAITRDGIVWKIFHTAEEAYNTANKMAFEENLDSRIFQDTALKRAIY